MLETKTQQLPPIELPAHTHLPHTTVLGLRCQEIHRRTHCGRLNQAPAALVHDHFDGQYPLSSPADVPHVITITGAACASLVSSLNLCILLQLPLLLLSKACSPLPLSSPAAAPIRRVVFFRRGTSWLSLVVLLGIMAVLLEYLHRCLAVANALSHELLSYFYKREHIDALLLLLPWARIMKPNTHVYEKNLWIFVRWYLRTQAEVISEIAGGGTLFILSVEPPSKHR